MFVRSFVRSFLQHRSSPYSISQFKIGTRHFSPQQKSTLSAANSTVLVAWKHDIFSVEFFFLGAIHRKMKNVIVEQKGEDTLLIFTGISYHISYCIFTKKKKSLRRYEFNLEYPVLFHPICVDREKSNLFILWNIPTVIIRFVCFWRFLSLVL